jgi:hypothetical protein
VVRARCTTRTPMRSAARPAMRDCSARWTACSISRPPSSTARRCRKHRSGEIRTRQSAPAPVGWEAPDPRLVPAGARLRRQPSGTRLHGYGLDRLCPRDRLDLLTNRVHPSRHVDTGIMDLGAPPGGGGAGWR